MQQINKGINKGFINSVIIPALGLFLITFTSCYSTKNTVLFRSLPRDTVVSKLMEEDFDIKIQKNDLLSIDVTSLNSDMDVRFNPSEKSMSMSSSATGESTGVGGFEVDKNGKIKLHYIGEIAAEGLTLTELKKRIEDKLLTYMKEPIVTVHFMNKKVTVIGEVGTPRVIYMHNNQEPLLDILAKSGDLKENAIASDLLVLRDSADRKIVKHINLEDHAFLNSTWYYSRPGDVVYVAKDLAKSLRDEKKRDLQFTLSLIVSLASLTVIILNILFK